MKKKFEDLMQAVTSLPRSGTVGLSQIANILGNLSPGLYGIVGPDQTGVHLALELFRANIGSPRLYYGYALDMLTVATSAYTSLSRFPLPMLRSQLWTMRHNVRWQPLTDNYSNAVIVDCYQANPSIFLTIDRIADDVKDLEKIANHLPIVIIDDFNQWVAPIKSDVFKPKRFLEALASFGSAENVVMIVVMDAWPGFEEKLMYGANAVVKITKEETPVEDSMSVGGWKVLATGYLVQEGNPEPLRRESRLTYDPLQGVYLAR